WINHFGDPGYRYHTLMTRLWGVLSLRLADSDVLPYDFASYASEIRKYIGELDAANHVSGHVDLQALRQSIDAFEKSAQDLNATIAKALASGKIDAAAADKLNHSLMEVERKWCNPSGIPGRPWFKHTIYAARYTYAHLELPGVTEAAETGNWKVAAQQAQIIERELQTNTELLRAASRDFASSSQLSH
ncbi:MAG TPA: transferrin receptor-like dimerization domain-containing protein, partial [Candidatus Acidoferrales bacterium]|nr:transferrin receptor-like dimerization domain-containing protein [Candidatus Acidoferrales bacterium]